MDAMTLSIETNIAILMRSGNMSEIKQKEVVVTGGAGFIGSNIVERLAASNNVTVIDNLHTGSESNLREAREKGNVIFVKDDVKNISKMGLEADFIFHLGIYSASPMYRENPRLVAEVVDGFINILEFARKKEIPVVFASTSSIYNGINPPHSEDVQYKVTDYYTEARIACERLAELYYKLYNIDVAAMRLFSVYGKNEKAKEKFANLVTQFVWAMKDGKRPEIYGDGTQRRDFVNVKDVVEAFILAAKKNKGFEVYNVGTGKNFDLNELVNKINKKLGNSIKPKYIPMPYKNYVMETLADTRKASKKLGFKAKITLDQGLDMEIKEYA